jgi:hypothetical protein
MPHNNHSLLRFKDQPVNAMKIIAFYSQNHTIAVIHHFVVKIIRSVSYHHALNIS